jgi:hypothetical protein
VTIKAPDLVEIARVQTDFVIAGQTDAHPQNNFGRQELADAAASCFNDYLADMEDAQLPYFLNTNSSTFVVTEVGLPSGGMFDIDRNWKNPHQTHRFGRQMDVRKWDMFDRNRINQLTRSCRLAGLRLKDEGDPPHFHLSLGPP